MSNTTVMRSMHPPEYFTTEVNLERHCFNDTIGESLFMSFHSSVDNRCALFLLKTFGFKPCAA